MKILIMTCDKFPPYYPDLKYLFATELVSRGHAIDWLLQSGSPRKRFGSESWEDTRAHVGPSVGGNSTPAKVIRTLLDFVNDFRVFFLALTNRYDIIQVKDKYVASLFGLLAARLSGARFTFWLSFPFPETKLHRARKKLTRYPLLYRIRGHLYSFLQYKVILPLADHVFVQSEQMRSDIMERGCPAEKMTAVPMGVPSDGHRKARRDPHRKPGKTVLYLGTMVRVRKLDFVLRMFRLVLRQEPDAHLMMVGGGEDSSDLEFLQKEAGRLGISDSVTFTGFVPWEEGMHHISRADVCVSPFYPTFILNSTSPTKVVEYGLMERPVVANDHPEQRRVLEESGGGLCVPYEEKAFAEAVIELLQNPDRARNMGRKGRSWAMANRSYSILAELVEERYRKILGLQTYSIAGQS